MRSEHKPMKRIHIFTTHDEYGKQYKCYVDGHGNLTRVYEDGTEAPADDLDYESYEMIFEDDIKSIRKQQAKLPCVMFPKWKLVDILTEANK